MHTHPMNTYANRQRHQITASCTLFNGSEIQPSGVGQYSTRFVSGVSKRVASMTECPKHMFQIYTCANMINVALIAPTPSRCRAAQMLVGQRALHKGGLSRSVQDRGHAGQSDTFNVCQEVFVCVHHHQLLQRVLQRPVLLLSATTAHHKHTGFRLDLPASLHRPTVATQQLLCRI